MTHRLEPASAVVLSASGSGSGISNGRAVSRKREQFRWLKPETLWDSADGSKRLRLHSPGEMGL